MKNNTATITSKGQITIPNSVRNKMHLMQGSKIEFISCDGFIMMIPIDKNIDSLKGILPKPKKSLSIEEMNNIIKGSYDRA